MYYIQGDFSFGILQLGEYDTFNRSHIKSLGKEIIDLSQPLPIWLAKLKKIHNAFIVSKFFDTSDVANALDFVNICKNHSIFITVITPIGNLTRSDLVELKNGVDIFLGIEDEYHEIETIVDPVSFAIDFMAHSFGECVEDLVSDSCYDGPFYAFSRSGSATLVVFTLMKSDYEKKNEFQLPDEVVQQVSGKRLAFLYIKSGSDKSALSKMSITNALKKASGSMIYATWCSVSGLKTGERTWVTTIVSNMDNPNNNFGIGKCKRVF